VLNAAARVVSDTRKFNRGLTSLLHDELQLLDVPERVTYKMGVMVYRCLHGQLTSDRRSGTSVPRRPSHHILRRHVEGCDEMVGTSLLGFVYVPQTDTSSSYLAVDSAHTAVGPWRFRSLVRCRWSGTRCLTNSEIRRVVLTVLSSFVSCLVFTNVTSALEVFLGA